MLSTYESHLLYGRYMSIKKFKKVGAREKVYIFVVWRHTNCQGTRENVYKIEYKLHECSNVAGDKNSDLAAAERIIYTDYALLLCKV